MSNHCKVSIVVPTYNHGPYIRQCLDSLVAQKTTFPYEILVGEDESTDGTREICVEYAEKYPEKIRLFLNKREDVVYIDGYPTGRKNFLNLIHHAKGEFIAFCEGDDFWNVPDKLENQVNFLEHNLDYGLVHTNAALFYQKTSKTIDNFHKQYRFRNLEGNIYDILLRKNFIITPTVLIRKYWVDKLLKWEKFDWFKYRMGDFPIWLFTAYHAKIGYLPEVTATHRMLLESASNSKDIKKMVSFYESQYQLLHFFCQQFGCSNETRQYIEQRFARIFMKRYAVLGDRQRAFYNFHKLLQLANNPFQLEFNDYIYGLFLLPGINYLFRNVYRWILSKRAATF